MNPADKIARRASMVRLLAYLDRLGQTTPMNCAEQALHAHRIRRARQALARIDATPKRTFAMRAIGLAKAKEKERVRVKPLQWAADSAAPTNLPFDQMAVGQEVWAPIRWHDTMRYWANAYRTTNPTFQYEIKCVGDDAKLIRTE